MVDFTNICFYFSIEDDLGKKILEQIVALTDDKIDDKNNERFCSDLADLEDTNKSGNPLTDELFSYKTFSLVYKYAKIAEIDVVPVIYSILLDHELKFKLDHYTNKESIVTNVISKDFLKYSKIDEVNYKFCTSALVADLDRELSGLQETVFFDICKNVTKGAGDVEQIREIFKEYVNRFPLDENDYSDKAAIVRTLLNYGGTLSSARELIKKYFH